MQVKDGEGCDAMRLGPQPPRPGVTSKDLGSQRPDTEHVPEAQREPVSMPAHRWCAANRGTRTFPLPQTCSADPEKKEPPKKTSSTASDSRSPRH